MSIFPENKQFWFLPINVAWLLNIGLWRQYCLNKGYFCKNNLSTIERLPEIFPNWKDRSNTEGSLGNHGQCENDIASMTPYLELFV